MAQDIKKAGNWECYQAKKKVLVGDIEQYVDSLIVRPIGSIESPYFEFFSNKVMLHHSDKIKRRIDQFTHKAIFMRRD